MTATRWYRSEFFNTMVDRFLAWNMLSDSKTLEFASNIMQSLNI